MFHTLPETGLFHSISQEWSIFQEQISAQINPSCLGFDIMME
mgnify:CR=1 FL=1